MRPAWLEIDLDALARNVRSLQSYVGSRTELCAVIKANAYGHGLIPVAQSALQAGAAMLGVALLEEALQLRESGITAPILTFGSSLPEAAEEMVRADVHPFVSERATIRALSEAGVRQGKTAKVHLKVDTGMGRMGVSPEEAPEIAQWIRGLSGIELEGVCTHFATSDEDPDYLRQQNEVFRGVLQRLDAIHLRPAYCHSANSGAIQSLLASHYTLVRPGLLLYGCPPFPHLGPSLTPALQWKSRLVQVKSLKQGMGVGYGLTARLQRDSRLAVVPLGYADGWPRSISNRGRVLVRGQWAPVMGRVSMDQFTVDVTDITGAELGDEVTLIGAQGDRRQTADDLASAAQTNIQDILSGLSDRLRRVYLPFKPEDE